MVPKLQVGNRVCATLDTVTNIAQELTVSLDFKSTAGCNIYLYVYIYISCEQFFEQNYILYLTRWPDGQKAKQPDSQKARRQDSQTTRGPDDQMARGLDDQMARDPDGQRARGLNSQMSIGPEC